MPFKFSENICIADRVIGPGKPIFIIAEAGVAHFGSLEKAMALVDMASEAKADAIKFQTFKTDELISSESSEWVDRFRTRELPYDAFRKINAYCHKKRILFISTAHDEPSLEFLDSLNVPAFKIGSGELSNWPFLKKIASKKKPIIFSTGMYTMNEIEEALNVFSEAENPDVAVLHCVTSYPTSPSEVNLRAMSSIREKFGVITGYSDHTQGIHFPVAAAALGACVIEKHISLDFNIPNAQDWKVSCGPEDLRLMVQQIREIEQGLGSGIKAPGRAEMESILWARKSLVAACPISAGERITSSHLCAKRPGNGIPPSQINKVIDKKAKKDIDKDRIIRWEELI
ncbi:MAG: N-acetylneuraminate synthase family protein [Deltaproteobacteria bacterium]|nr:N-acetylneuraminate synthase family protein [Deltaproteobacteria bacterium]